MKPSPEEAAGALAEAAGRARSLRRTDWRFGLVLMVAASAYVAMGVLVGFARVLPFAVSLDVLALVVLAACLTFSLMLLIGLRAISRRASAWYSASIGAFGIWNALVVTVSMTTGWWARGESELHFTVSTAVAAVPLVIGAAVIGRRRR